MEEELILEAQAILDQRTNHLVEEKIKSLFRCVWQC